MKAPSIHCLRVLRAIALPERGVACARVLRRPYSTQQDQPPPIDRSPGSPPPPPLPAFKPPPQVPRHKLKELREQNDGVEFTPTPLSRPIGLPDPPRPGENMGLDTRTLRQRRDDFVNYDKHLERRVGMMRQKPYFKDWSNMRFHKGKQFYANERLFRAAHALFVPNFYGLTLRKDAVKKQDTKDGYGGLGRNTCEVMAGKITLLSIISSQWAQEQSTTFLSKEANPELQQILDDPKNNVQLVEINREENLLKWWLIQAFAPNLRKERSLEQQARYFMIKRALPNIVKESIGVLNDKVSYLYLVDPQLRIRWAASARAEPSELQSLNRGLHKLMEEAETPDEQSPVLSLEDAVSSVVQRQ